MTGAVNLFGIKYRMNPKFLDSCDNLMKDKSLAKNIAWNTIGNIFYLGCLWLLNLVVIRLSGSYTDAGILTLAISTTNIFVVLARFSVRDFQVSDIDQKYNQSDYVSLRVITCAAALLGCIGFVILNGYEWGTVLSISAYMAMRTVEAASDVVSGILQKQWRLDIVGKALIYRGASLILTFTVVYKLSKSLTTALFFMSASAVAIFCVYDIRNVRKLTTLSCDFQWNRLLLLARDCLPILAYSFFFNMIVSTSRFFLERFHGQEVLGYYGTVSTIAVIVQAAVSYIFNPLNGVFTSYYADSNRRAVLKLFFKVIGLLFAAVSAALLGVTLFGKPVLVLLFGKSIEPYVYLLMPTIVASGLTGLDWFLGMLLIINRSKKMLIVGAAAGFAISVVISVCLIPHFVFDGANIAIIAALSTVALVYLLAVTRTLPKTD